MRVPAHRYSVRAEDERRRHPFTPALQAGRAKRLVHYYSNDPIRYYHIKYDTTLLSCAIQYLGVVAIELTPGLQSLQGRRAKRLVHYYSNDTILY